MKPSFILNYISAAVIVTAVILLSAGCEDGKPRIVAPPELRVDLKLMDGRVPEDSINVNVPLGAWVYNSKGDSLGGYQFHFWLVPDSIGIISPGDTWIRGDITKRNGLVYDVYFIGRRNGKTIIYVEARDSINTVGQDTLTFTVKPKDEEG